MILRQILYVDLLHLAGNLRIMHRQVLQCIAGHAMYGGKGSRVGTNFFDETLQFYPGIYSFLCRCQILSRSSRGVKRFRESMPDCGRLASYSY